MAADRDFASIADATHPNPGRIYDYLLGGNHNFDVDRQAVDQILQVAPFAKKMSRLASTEQLEATFRSGIFGMFLGK